MKIAIVQLARYGDILCILPVAKFLHDQGHEVHFHAQQHFASILNGVKYVKNTFVAATVPCECCIKVRDEIKNRYHKVIVSQVEGNQPPYPTNNFIHAQWMRAGDDTDIYWKQFHDLPLVLDGYLPPTKITSNAERPILVNLQGSTQGYPQRDTFLKWLNESHGPNVVNLTGVEFCDFLEWATWIQWAKNRRGCLITIDTATLHLGYAFNIPTIMLTSGGWGQSEPHKNVITTLTYEQSVSPEGLTTIESALQAALQ